VAELANSQDQAALGEIWALTGGGGTNTQIATASAVTRNNCIGTPRVTRSRHIAVAVAQRRLVCN